MYATGRLHRLAWYNERLQQRREEGFEEEISSLKPFPQQEQYLYLQQILQRQIQLKQDKQIQEQQRKIQKQKQKIQEQKQKIQQLQQELVIPTYSATEKKKHCIIM